MSATNQPMSLAPWPSFDDRQRQAVDRVLASGRVNYWTGTEGKAFEQEFAAYCEVTFAVAVANGTLALELALRAVGIQSGDEVIVTSRSFMASASAVLMVGAIPVFADVDLDSQNITAGSIQSLITPKTRAVICVHLAGWPCDMQPIVSLARQHGMKVVEDCAQAHGARYQGRPVGSLGDSAAFSFCQDKIISTGGEGGMLVTADPEVAKRAWSFKDHGKNRDKISSEQPSQGFRWLHDSLGSNYRMTEMQAAIGRIQLAQLDQWRTKRQQHARTLDLAVQGLGCIREIRRPSSNEHACYKHYLFVEPEGLVQGWSRDRVINELGEKGVPVFSGSCPEIYREKLFVDRQLGPATRWQNAQLLGETSLMFLVHPTLTDVQMGWVCEQVQTVLRLASR